MEEDEFQLPESEFSFVEGQSNLEQEISDLAAIASAENSELAQLYHDDVLAEDSFLEGIASDDDPGLSGAGTSENFEVIPETTEDKQRASSSALVDNIPGYNRPAQVNAALNSLAPTGLKHFWETDFWTSMLDGRTDTIHGAYNFCRPGGVVPLESIIQAEPSHIKLEHKPKVYEGFLECVKSLPIQSWREEREALHDRAVRRWVYLLDAWSTDVKIVACLKECDTFKQRAQILVDIFFNKAPATIMKRRRSLSRVTNYFVDRGMKFPCNEDQFYGFLNVERNNGAPPSRLKGIFESVVFARHVLGVEQFMVLIESRRCLGACGNKDFHIVAQATPLTVKQLTILHKVLDEDPEPWNQMYAGMALFCTYARSRWSDAQHTEELVFDEGPDGTVAFVEASVAVHKTARAMNLRHQFLPLVAPSVGVVVGNWAEKWRGVRDRLNLMMEIHPLMPAPDENSKPTARPLGTEEASNWLKYLLGRHEKLNGKYTSHSYKATCLSYLAKRGINHQDRLVLGHHVSGVRMALTYSRDAASRPIRVLERMLAEIRSGAFEPDASRSGRLLKRKRDEVVAGSVVVPSADTVSKLDADVEGPDGGSGDESDHQSHVTTDSSTDSEPETTVKPVRVERKILPPPGTELWVHTKLRTRHLTFQGYIKTFVCGRSVGPLHERTVPVSEFDAPICRQCFNSKQLEPQG